ncbi:hypothetical protein VP01_1725g5 [Puccinia sorghi]|uniref:Uncharacterized protein n=1 Tax=Puccinia sorghi TaxID=27349 RepID=A0A0L6VFF1_9BASI|nr:hypothetical protein VP01_1725g5 [Puccinia sorghi]
MFFPPLCFSQPLHSRKFNKTLETNQSKTQQRSEDSKISAICTHLAQSGYTLKLLHSIMSVVVKEKCGLYNGKNFILSEAHLVTFNLQISRFSIFTEYSNFFSTGNKNKLRNNQLILSHMPFLFWLISSKMGHGSSNTEPVNPEDSSSSNRDSNPSSDSKGFKDDTGNSNTVMYLLKFLSSWLNI